jgi:crotonobetaine/carnitine-CoA ligase
MTGPTQTEVDRYQMAGQDLPWLLDQWAEAKPDHPFLIWEPREGDSQRWGYRAFRDEVAQIAAGLRARGVDAGDKVLIHAENCPEAVLAWYACAWIGAVGVTTNTRSVGAEMEYFAGHTECVGAITQPQFAAMVSEHAKKLSWICVTEDNSGAPPSAGEAAHGKESFSALSSGGDSLPRSEPDPMRPVGIMFTSGTTSRPKAVVHTHANALWAGRVAPRSIDLTGDDTYLVYLPFFHVNAQSWSIWAALGVGATIVLQPKFSASRFWEVIAKHEVSHISLIPFVFKAVAAQPVPDHSVRVGVFGLIMPELEGWLKMRVLPAYGMTETVIQAIHADPRLPFPNGTMGKPTPGYEFIVMDVESGRVCEQDEIGELWVRGTRGIQLFLEYYDNPEANAKSFTEDGWFKTGDRVRLGAGGNFFYRDRDKDSLKVGGENVSAREVEDCCRLAGGIGDVAVVARPHSMLDMVPVAFVIKGPDAPADDDAFAEKILEQCKTNLADFKVPRAVYFVDEFPLATLDKVAKNKLREIEEMMPPIE